MGGRGASSMVAEQRVSSEQNVVSLAQFLAARGLSSPISDYTLDTTRLPHGETQRQCLIISQIDTAPKQAEYKRLYNQYKQSGMSTQAAKHVAWQKATGDLERKLSDKVAELSSNGAIYYARNRRYNVNR